MSYPPPGGPPPGGPPPGSYPPGPPGSYPPGYPHVPPTNGKATAALVTGITTLVLSWCCGFGVLGLVAIVLGSKARSEIRRSGGTQAGDGLAVAGIATGAVAVLVGLLVIAAIAAALLGGQGVFEGYVDGVDV